MCRKRNSPHLLTRDYSSAWSSWRKPYEHPWQRHRWAVIMTTTRSFGRSHIYMFLINPRMPHSPLTRLRSIFGRSTTSECHVIVNIRGSKAQSHRAVMDEDSTLHKVVMNGETFLQMSTKNTKHATSPNSESRVLTTSTPGHIKEKPIKVTVKEFNEFVVYCILSHVERPGRMYFIVYRYDYDPQEGRSDAVA